MRSLVGCLLPAVLAIFTLAAQPQFLGSVATGAASPSPISLSLHDAIDRGLRTNLGLLVSNSESEVARGERIRSLSALLPTLDAAVNETVEQLNLKTIGFNVQ